jgi:hypothetical protein
MSKGRFKKYCKRGHLRTPENLSTNRTCRACTILSNHQHYEDHKKEHIAYQSMWKKKNAGRVRDTANKLNAALKLEVLTHYGPAGFLCCYWPGCFVTDIDMLTLDHIDDKDVKQKDKVGKRITGNQFYRWVKNNKYPKGLQTLCGSHQFKKLCLQRRADKIS